MSSRVRVAMRWLLAAGMVAIGVDHFVHPETFIAIMPPEIPWHRELVLLSGACEIAGGLGLLPERTRRVAGLGLCALYLAVFPANVHMALRNISLPGTTVPPALLWARLALQPLFVVWALWVSRRSPGAEK